MLLQKEGFSSEKRKRTINLGGELIVLDQPLVMGILNMTPDSFFDGGKHSSEKRIVEHVGKMLDEGAAFIDIGGCSTRPGAAEVPEEEELKRVLCAARLIRKHFPAARLSVDTFRSAVARKVTDEAGACIINDISGGALDEKMFETIAGLQVPYILMHIQGTPQTMQDNPVYDDLVGELISYFSGKVNALHQLGVNDVIIDPGLGFGKTLGHNYALMNRFDAFVVLGLPLLAGVSRKSMIFRLLECSPEAALNGTSVLNTVALLGGADILRVHDVREAVEAIKIVEKLKSTIA